MKRNETIEVNQLKYFLVRCLSITGHASLSLSFSFLCRIKHLVNITFMNKQIKIKIFSLLSKKKKQETNEMANRTLELTFNDLHL